MGSHKPMIYVAPENYSILTEKSSSINKENKTLKSRLTNTVKEPLIASLLIGFLFPPTAPFAIAAAAARSYIVDTFLSSESLTDKKMNNDEDRIIKILNKTISELNIESWKSHIELITFSSIPNDIEFPPGHPLPEHLYRVHPLNSKKKKYIPIEIFDNLLYEEREAELIYLLTDLGATKITFREITNQNDEYSINTEAKITGAGGLEGKGENKRNQSQDNSQIIKLIGKHWNPNMAIDKEKYSWLSYEPSWERLVHTRLVGGALSTTIELTIDDSYSISGQLKLAEGLLQNLGALGGGITISQASKKKKLFEVEFADSIEKAQ